jgi:hypothetical protein
MEKKRKTNPEQERIKARIKSGLSADEHPFEDGEWNNWGCEIPDYEDPEDEDPKEDAE